VVGAEERPCGRWDFFTRLYQTLALMPLKGIGTFRRLPLFQPTAETLAIQPDQRRIVPHREHVALLSTTGIC